VTAAALEPSLFSNILVRNGMPSFKYLLEKPVRFQEAPELFCLDLHKLFDLDAIVSVAEPTGIVQQGSNQACPSPTSTG
jgi:hypothetical protein